MELILLVFIQVIFVTMVYGPIAPISSSIPGQDQYTSLSALSYRQRRVRRVVPLIGLYVVRKTGNIYAGLYYQ